MATAARRLAALQERWHDLAASLEKLMPQSDASSMQPINGVHTVTPSGVNFQVFNGRGLTESINGAGNIIIGYDEANRLTDQSYCSIDRNAAGTLLEDGTACIAAGGVFGPVHKSGSHNLIVGSQNNYSSAGAIVDWSRRWHAERVSPLRAGWDA